MWNRKIEKFTKTNPNTIPFLSEKKAKWIWIRNMPITKKTNTIPFVSKIGTETYQTQKSNAIQFLTKTKVSKPNLEPKHTKNKKRIPYRFKRNQKYRNRIWNQKIQNLEPKANKADRIKFGTEKYQKSPKTKMKEF